MSALPLSRTSLLLLGLAILSSCQTRPAGQTAEPIPAKAMRKLQEASAHIDAPSFNFPWKGIEKYMASQADGKLLLVGYGSLLNVESAGETVDTRGQDFMPVIAAGAKRVFNYQIPPPVLKELGGHPSARESAALNVIATGHPGDLINGRIMKVAVNELPALRKREYGYHLRPVVCLPWNDPSAKPFVAYVLAAEEPIVKGQRVVNPELLPNPEYVKICLDGAKSVSPKFADVFLDTSYLGNGKTTLREWLADLRNASGH